MTGTAIDSYTLFVEGAGQRLRLGLIARYGPDVGAEATAEALAYGWEHWDRLASMPNPAGYLYRVGQSRSRALFRGRRSLNRRASFPVPSDNPEPFVEPALPKALRSLSEKQRVAVFLVHGFGYSVREVAELLDVAPSTVQRNADRALTGLRDSLGVSDVA
jgi:DNA-directed RNA polymerase specialized sigma24 family protein